MPLDPKDGIGSYIKDFKKSKAPQFKGKSDKKKRDMAVAAYLDAKRGPQQEASFAGSNLKLFGQLNRDRSIPELSMSKRIKAKVQRGLVGPSTKKKPLMFRTMGKDAKDMQKKADVITVTKKAPDTKMAIAKRALNKEGFVPNYADKMKNKNINKSDKDKLIKMRQMLDKEKKPIKKEATSFKVSIDGLPDLYMTDKTPGALLQKLRKIVKQPSLIKDVDRIEKSKVKKAYRDKAQGREVKEYKYDYGTPESVKLMKKTTPGQNEARGADSKGHFRSTDSGAGMTAKGVAAHRRKNPGSKLSTAVTGKVKPGSKAANRRKSFCARMSGMKGPMKDEKGRPTRKAMSLKRWKC